LGCLQLLRAHRFALPGAAGRQPAYGIDIRTIGLVAGIELEPRAHAPGSRAYDVFVKCFETGLLIRTTVDIVALSPPLIIERNEIEKIISIFSKALKSVG
jgi:beta-alanine--pyruvate transaminase